MEAIKRSGNQFFLKPHQVVVKEGFNIRKDMGDLQALADSIVANGVKVMLRGVYNPQEETFTLTDGHRRLAAVKLAYEQGHTDIYLPFLRENKMSEAERTLGMITYNDGKPLTMLEEGDCYNRLVNYGWAIKDIMQKTGKTHTHISNCISIFASGNEIKELVASGDIAPSTAIDLLRSKTEDEVVKMVEEAKFAGAKITRKDVVAVRAEKADKRPSKLDLLESIVGDCPKDTKDNLNVVLDFLKGNITFDDLKRQLTV